MPSDNDPSQPPPAKLPEQPNPTTIDSLGDDILREIFIRLPSLTTLIRAAFACPAWRRAVASSPDFRRRFRALHPEPLLLGLFFAPLSPAQAPNVPAFPAFLPSRRPDRELAAAVRGGDFFLTSIQDRPGAAPGWDINDCRDGFVLLSDWKEDSLVLLNPLSRRSHGFFELPGEDLFDDHRGFPVMFGPHLIYSDEDPMSFRVVYLAHDESRVRVAILSSDTKEWRILPWVQVVPDDDDRFTFEDNVDEYLLWLQCGTQDSGQFIYWVFRNRKSIVTLDTATMEFSVNKIPSCLKHRSSFVRGETKDGAPCIVYTEKMSIGVLLRGEDADYLDDGEIWFQHRLDSLETEVSRVIGDLPDDHELNLNIVAMMNGFLYLATSKRYHDPRTPCWFLSLCLETMKLEKLFLRTFDSNVYPYFLAWPRSLVGDYGRFAHELAP